MNETKAPDNIEDDDIDLDEESRLAQATDGEPVAEQVKLLEAENADLRDKYMRALAEFENFKKRAQKERSELLKYQGEKIFYEILGVLDDLELALSHANSDPQSLKTGVELIYKKFLDMLSKFEVRGESGIGKEFDPTRHQAISRIVSPDTPSGTIVNELKKTYFYKDKLLRPGEVVVAEGPDQMDEPGNGLDSETIARSEPN